MEFLIANLFMVLKKARCELNRKVLADMAISDPSGFAALVGCAREALA